VPVTVDTGQSQIRGCSLTAMLLGDDVIGLVGKQYVTVVNEAIFAATSRPFPDMPA